MPRGIWGKYFINFALIILIFSSAALADVTGSFGTHVLMIPQTTASEIALVDFDVQNDLNVTFSISGLKTTLHSHFGIAGVEDAILTLDAVTGFMTHKAGLVFGRFLDVDPFYEDLHFIAKIFTTEFGLGGVTFVNEAHFEDINAFVSQTPAYAFGDTFSITGQTLSGITISAAAGICLQQENLVIKKHQLSSTHVNPDCATTPKPDLLFDFEVIQISNLPIAPGVTGDTLINCITTNACSLTTTLSFGGGPIQFSTSLSFSDLLSLDFSGAQLEFQTGPATFSLTLSPTGELSQIALIGQAVLNPEENPATLSFNVLAVPGVGLTQAIFSVSVQRAGLALSATTSFLGGPPAELANVIFSFAANLPGSLGELDSTAVFGPSTGLLGAETHLTVYF